MKDTTEPIRRQQVAEINSAVESTDEDKERQRLTGIYGQVWDTNELGKDFEVLSFSAPLVVVRQRSTGKLGTLQFQHRPRFYFNWGEHQG